MANLTQNLELLRLGKQNLIDKINTKLIDSDKEILSIDCEWADVINLLSKIRVKRDHSAEIDTNAIYTDLCEGTFNTEIVTAVTSIMAYAMYGQTYLPKITGENVTSIGTYAFYNCENLTDAIFPNVTQISTNAFYNCAKLDNVDFSKVTIINSNGFYNCGFESINIPKIITIGGSSFSNCKNLRNIILNSENTYTIEQYAFDNCTNLETDVTANATSIGTCAIRNTKITSIESNTVSSISNQSIENNSELEQINLPNITNLSTRSISDNPKLQSILLAGVTQMSGVFSNNTNLELVYLPNITEFRANNIAYYSIFTKCPKITNISWPNAVYNNMYNSYQGYSGLALDCDGLITVDLSSMKYWCTYYYFYDNRSAWLINNAKSLRTINLSSLEYSNPTYKTSAHQAYNRAALLLQRVGCEAIALPSLKYWWASDYAQIVTNCYNLTSLSLPNLISIGTNSRDPNSWKCSIVSGCPNLTEIELPLLESIYGNGIFSSANQKLYNDSITSTQEQTYAQDSQYQKKYIENMLDYYKFRYPANYETKADYRKYYERLHGGVATAGDFESASPWNNGINSSWGYNQAWCGLKKIKLPKLSNWVSYLCYYTTELEELYLGDGTFIPTTTSLPNYFVQHAWNLRKVVLNYPTVLTASNALTTVFSNCPHLDGSRYETVNYSGAYWYHANPEQLRDLYFYVPDDLVDSYKSATNWSTFASQIRPISELSDTVIDSSITEIEAEEYKDNQELNTIAGYGITTIGNRAFYNSSVIRAEFPSAENIDTYAFAECQNLTEVTLAASRITAIAEGIFRDTALTEATYLNVITINKDAFYGCQDLESISIPNCKVIYDNAFSNTNLSVLVAAELVTISNNAFKNSSLESLTLPKITSISNNAFENNAITSLTFDTLITIGDSAFKNNNITSISFTNLTSIGANAFEDNNITSVNIPKIAVIKDNAFKDNTNLTSINLASVVSLGSNVFSGCSSLTDITFEGYIVPTVGENTIESTYILHVRPEMIDDFQAAFPNNNIIGDVE